MSISDLFLALFVLIFGGWALRRSWVDMGRPWPGVLTFKERSTKGGE